MAGEVYGKGSLFLRAYSQFDHSLVQFKLNGWSLGLIEENMPFSLDSQPLAILPINLALTRQTLAVDAKLASERP